MTIPTEPIGSIPRPRELIEGAQALMDGKITEAELNDIYTRAVKDTIKKFEETGSPVISDGEQTKPSFATYPIHQLDNIQPHGVIIPFADGHERQLPLLTSGPFRYHTYAVKYLEEAKKYATVPVKQAVITASAISLIYPQEEIQGYSKEMFLKDLINEAESDIRQCIEKGAYNVQMDFTEGRLSVKLDPSKQLLKTFISLNNQVLDRFSEKDRKKIGIHVCPGGDLDSTHSADIEYTEFLPDLFQMNTGNFYIQLASENNRRRVLECIKEYSRPHQKIFVGVIDINNPKVETPEEVKERVLEAAEYIDPARLGTTDDCGFSPFGDDISTSRETAFNKISSRVIGTQMAAKELGI